MRTHSLLRCPARRAPPLETDGAPLIYGRVCLVEYVDQSSDTPRRGALAGAASIAPDLLRLVNPLQAGKIVKRPTSKLHAAPKPELSSPVKQLVEMHGGHVEAQSAGVEKGATFLVTLPLSGSPAQRHRRADLLGHLPGRARMSNVGRASPALRRGTG